MGLIGRKPKTAEEWFNLAYEEKDAEKQVEYFSKSLEINPKNVSAWLWKGDTLFYNLEKYEESIECYNKALRINPNDALAWNNKGLVLDKLGRYKDAGECYNKALELNRNYADAHYNLGVLLQSQGANKYAKIEFKEVLRIKPEDTDAKKHLEELESKFAKAIEIHIKHDILEGIKAHCREYAEKPHPLEALGLLIGDRFKDVDYGGKFTHIFYAITSKLNASSTRVKFDAADVEQLMERFYDIKNNASSCPICGEKLRGAYCKKCDYNLDDLKIVGWYHSHPGFTCFMSGTDIATHRTYFPRDFHVALVVDPINRDMKFFKVKNGRYFQVGYGIYK